MAQEEKWDYKGTSDKQILYNYLCYTYDRIKAENKIEISDDKSVMCFNTGLLNEHGADIYTDKSTKEAKIQLLLPLFLQSRDVADLALVVDKGEFNYVGKTILTIEWAYVNSRRIVKPDVEWLKI